MAMVSLLYLLFAVPCMDRQHAPFADHDTVEIVHLPRITGGKNWDADRIAHELRPSGLTADQVAGSTSGGPAVTALICAIGLAILALFPAATILAFFRTAEAVLGVGRWHRAVVPLL